MTHHGRVESGTFGNGAQAGAIESVLAEDGDSHFQQPGSAVRTGGLRSSRATRAPGGAGGEEARTSVMAKRLGRMSDLFIQHVLNYNADHRRSGAAVQDAVARWCMWKEVWTCGLPPDRRVPGFLP